MVSSSAVIAKMLQDQQLQHERAGQLALGIAVLEDVVAIVMLTILTSYTKIGSAEAHGTVSTVLTGLSGFVVLIVMGALLFVPRLLRRLETRADPELQTIIVAGLLLMLALASVWAGYSLALGAFLLGAVVAELPQRRQVEHSFIGVRDIFSSVFFVSIGMMIEPELLLEVWPWILGLGVFVLIVRPVSVGLALVLTGTPPHDARRAGLAVSPLGEFSFIIAQMGVHAGVLPKTQYALAVGVSLVTVLVAPLINRHAGPLLHFIETHEPKRLRRMLETYHGWLRQIAAAPGNRLWWRRGRKDVLTFVIEILIVTGLLLFAETIYHALEKSRITASLDEPTFRLIFWVAFGLVMLLPLAGMARAAASLAVGISESLRGQTRVPDRVIRNLVRASALGITALWLWYLVPTGLLSVGSWWILGGILAVVMILFSRRLVALQSHWQGSVEKVLGDVPVNKVPRRWQEQSHDWALNLQAIELPEAAACAGRTIAALKIRSRLGCTIVEINRQGYVLAGPEPTVSLFPGDRLLVLGSAEQLATARVELTRKTAAESDAFDDARLETMTVPENPLITGQTHWCLRIPHRTGAVVVGIRRGGTQQTNPSGDVVLAAGDEILVIGAAQELKALTELLHASPIDPGAVGADASEKLGTPAT
jgi:CPA2 family monovalent cation:H+ antiporter-2